MLPTATERLDGVAVTPAGSDPSLIATLPLKLFTGEVPTVRICDVPPAVSVTDEGSTCKEKLGELVWVVVVVVVVFVLVPPQPASALRTARVPK
jgi:hypothetical protein